MAAPLSTTQWIDALEREGVDVRYASNWATAGRDSATGKTFGPVYGVVIHHTAGTNSLAIVRDGRSDLPGPLAHAHLAKDGKLTQLSAHRTNHAGTFAQNAVDAVKAESSVHPKPAAAEPVDGNDCFYGLEIENLGNGKDPYPAVQYDQAVRWAAAICRAHGWSAQSVIGHKEGTTRKIDPSLSMAAFRADVEARLSHYASWNPGDTPEENSMAISDADAVKIARTLLSLDEIPNPNAATVDTNPNITLTTAVRNLEKILRRLEAKLDALP